jgi:hypothetical protein
VFTGYLKGLPPDSGYAIRIPVTDEEAGMGQVIVWNLDDKIIAALKATDDAQVLALARSADLKGRAQPLARSAPRRR